MPFRQIRQKLHSQFQLAGCGRLASVARCLDETNLKGQFYDTNQVSKKDELPAAIDEMIKHDGPFLLEMICPYQEHVLPMIPGGGTVRDIITE